MKNVQIIAASADKVRIVGPAYSRIAVTAPDESAMSVKLMVRISLM